MHPHNCSPSRSPTNDFPPHLSYAFDTDDRESFSGNRVCVIDTHSSLHHLTGTICHNCPAGRSPTHGRPRHPLYAHHTDDTSDNHADATTRGRHSNPHYSTDTHRPVNSESRSPMNGSLTMMPSVRREDAPGMCAYATCKPNTDSPRSDMHPHLHSSDTCIPCGRQRPLTSDRTRDAPDTNVYARMLGRRSNPRSDTHRHNRSTGNSPNCDCLRCPADAHHTARIGADTYVCAGYRHNTPSCSYTHSPCTKTSKRDRLKSHNCGCHTAQRPDYRCVYVACRYNTLSCSYTHSPCNLKPKSGCLPCHNCECHTAQRPDYRYAYAVNTHNTPSCSYTYSSH